MLESSQAAELASEMKKTHPAVRDPLVMNN
jgi:hypothetical protein